MGSRDPTKDSFFVRCVAKDKILIIDNHIQHRKVIMNLCCQCLIHGELLAHKVIHCPITRALWVTILFACCIACCGFSYDSELIQELYGIKWDRIFKVHSVCADVAAMVRKKS